MPPLDTNGFLDKEVSNWVNQFRSQFAEWFELAEEINHFCYTQMYKIDAHNEDIEEVLVATLYIRAMTTFQSIIILAERGLTAQAKMLSRCMFDSIFPLVAIARDQDHKYFREYILSDLITRKNYTRKYKKLTTAKQDHLKELEKLESELTKEIKGGNIEKLTTLEWAQRAELEDWYHSIYSTLSDAVHSSPRNLEQYLVLDSLGKIKEINWGPNENEIEEVLMTALQEIITAIQALVNFFKFKETEILKNF